MRFATTASRSARATSVGDSGTKRVGAPRNSKSSSAEARRPSKLAWSHSACSSESPCRRETFCLEGLDALLLLEGLDALLFLEGFFLEGFSLEEAVLGVFLLSHATVLGISLVDGRTSDLGCPSSTLMGGVAV